MIANQTCTQANSAPTAVAIAPNRPSYYLAGGRVLEVREIEMKNPLPKLKDALKLALGRPASIINLDDAIEAIQSRLSDSVGRYLHVKNCGTLHGGANAAYLPSIAIHFSQIAMLKAYLHVLEQAKKQPNLLNGY